MKAVSEPSWPPDELPPKHVSGSRNFRERWAPVRTLESGNQGLAFEAADSTGRRAFVKEFKPDERSGERRARFCREVRILERLNVSGVPRLLESNAAYHADPSYELYLAAE